MLVAYRSYGASGSCRLAGNWGKEDAPAVVREGGTIGKLSSAFLHGIFQALPVRIVVIWTGTTSKLSGTVFNDNPDLKSAPRARLKAAQGKALKGLLKPPIPSLGFPFRETTLAGRSFQGKIIFIKMEWVPNRSAAMIAALRGFLQVQNQRNKYNCNN